MSPGPPAKALRVRVPRQNAQRLGPAVTAEVQNVARAEGLLVQLPPPVQEQPGVLGTSSESASEWNSLLTSARAQRGPQWDVGTQQFLVEKESKVYYDPTVLLEATRKLKESSVENKPNNAGSSSQRGRHNSLQPPSININTSGHGNPMSAQQYRSPYPNQTPYGSSAMSPMTAQGTPRNPGFSGTPFGAMPPNQFYGDGLTPTGGRGGMPDNMAISPMPPRRITRGMAEEYPGLYGN